MLFIKIQRTIIFNFLSTYIFCIYSFFTKRFCFYTSLKVSIVLSVLNFFEISFSFNLSSISSHSYSTWVVPFPATKIDRLIEALFNFHKILGEMQGTKLYWSSISGYSYSTSVFYIYQLLYNLTSLNLRGQHTLCFKLHYTELLCCVCSSSCCSPVPRSLHDNTVWQLSLSL